MARFIDKAREFLPFLPGGKSRPTHREVMALRPLRNPHAQWERSGDDGLVTITLTRSLAHRWDRLIGIVFQIPTARKIDMSDELSSRVWELCDGNHTVAAISTEIGHQYQLGQRQAEVSVLTFLNTLQSKRLVGLAPVGDRLKASPSASTAKAPAGGGSRSGSGDHSKGSKGYYASRKQRAR